MKQTIATVILAILTVVFAILFILASMGKIGVGNNTMPAPISDTIPAPTSNMSMEDQIKASIVKSIQEAILEETNKSNSQNRDQQLQMVMEQIEQAYAQEAGLTVDQLYRKTPPISVPLKDLTYEQAYTLEHWYKSTGTAVRMQLPIVQKAMALLSTVPNTGADAKQAISMCNKWPAEIRGRIHEAWSEANREDYTEQEWEFVQTVLQGIDLE